MNIRFDGKVVIVTGAGAGLGRQYALDLSSRGAKVVVNDLGTTMDGQGGSQSAADNTVKAIIDAGGQAIPSYDSVATIEGGESIVANALTEWGRVDGVIANAGILRDRSFVKLDYADMDAVFDVHLRGGFFVLAPAFRAMKEAGEGGGLVVTTSASGLFGNFGQSAYGAAKSGLVGLIRTLAIEGKKYGIRANALAPIAATRLTTNTMEETGDEGKEAELSPAKVSPLATYLVHPECPATGEIYMAGGGWFTRCAMVAGSGWVAGDTDYSVEDVAEHFGAVRDLSSLTEPTNAMEVGAIMRAHMREGC
jgi:NAD(P)-dependent dehydrogenase (short-subunit alcohol dehydrogenase family)